MTNPLLKKATATTPGDAAKYAAPELKYVFEVIEGLHSTDKIQLENIEGFVPAYDVVVYQLGTKVYARRANGVELYSGTANSGANDITAINTACNIAVVDAKPITIWIKPGTYQTNSSASNIVLVSNLTIFAYGVTIKYVGSAHSTYFLLNTGATAGASDVRIQGLTVDCNSLCQGIRFYGADGTTQSRNVTIQDCTFKNMYTSYFLLFNYSIPSTSNPADIPTLKNRDIAVLNCNFIAGDTSGATNTLPIVRVVNTRNFAMRGCIFEGHTDNNSAAVAMDLYCDVCVVSNNIFKSSASGVVLDFLLSQSRNIIFTNNKFPQRFHIQDCRNIVIGGGNRLNHLKIIDVDSASTIDSHPALYRSTRYILITSNIFDTVPAYDGQAFDTAISLDATANTTNSPKHLSIMDNIVRCRVSFFDLVAALPNGAAGGPIEDIMISSNNIVERTTTTEGQALINLPANTTLTAHGLTRLFIAGNYFCLKHTDSPAINDIALGGTGFTNVVIRKNHFNNEGIGNVSSYTTISRNFGDATTRRDFNSGVQQLTPSGTTLTVTHGLQYTPVVQDIYVVPTTSLGAAAKYWISAVTSTTFTITIDAAATPTFAWRAGRIA